MRVERLPYWLLLIPGLLLSCDPADGGLTAEDADSAAAGMPLAECEQFLACVAAVDAGTLDEQTALYGPDGTCWDGQAAACDQACDGARLAYESVHPIVPACWDDGDPDPLYLFGEGEGWSWDVGACSLVSHITGADTVFEGPDHTEFIFHGTISDEQYEWPFSTRCGFSGYEFECEDHDVENVPDVWSFSGEFAGDFQSADWQLTVDYEGAVYPCYLSGSPYR